MTAGGTKKVGPNDHCTCGSGKKAKKCCHRGGSPGRPGSPAMESPMGQVLPGSVDELWTAAVSACQAGNYAKATHLYSMTIDAAVKGMPRDQNGSATDADLLKYNKCTEGKLSKLLCERSKLHVLQGNATDAITDAETCIRADPSFEQGHLRLIAAYEAAGAVLKVQLEVCERGIDACPASEVLITRKWRLKKAIADLPDEQLPQACVEGEPSIEQTRRIADDASDPRRAMAAADLGGALAVGAYGLEKDLDEAERYLRIASDGGEVAAQRNLGLILLDAERPVEGAQELSKAAAAGDEEATEVLRQLHEEVQLQQAEARKKLEAIASGGDPRAAAMLESLYGKA